MGNTNVSAELLADELFPWGTLCNPLGDHVPTCALEGKSVALLFCDGYCPRCLTVVPMLIQFYKSVNSGGMFQKIEIVYVSCDVSRDSFQENIKRMPWLHVDFDDSHVLTLKKRFNIRESCNGDNDSFDAMEIPVLVVINGCGMEVQRFNLCHGREESLKALQRWDWRNLTFKCVVPDER